MKFTGGGLQIVWKVAYAMTAVGGAVLVWIVGHRGIYLYDQSGVFDGAWRMLQGQIMYKDFYAPYGPVVFWLQSLFFRITGVDFSSMVISAAALNGLAVLGVIWILRRLFPDSIHRPTAIAAGLVTAVWFQAPFGTLWFEQTSFFFSLAALVLVVETGFHKHNIAVYLRVAAGACLVLAVLSKQSAGVAFLPLPVGVAVLTSLPSPRKAVQAVFQIGVGCLIASTAFGLWLWRASSITGFWQSVVVMSSVLAGSRLGLIHNAAQLIFLRPTFAFVRAALLAFLVFAIFPGAFSQQNRRVAAWIVLSGIFLQNLFASTTFDEVYNSIGFVGLINGTAFALFTYPFWRKKQSGNRPLLYWGAAAIPILSGYLLFYRPIVNGWYYSRTRVVQQFDERTVFVGPVRVARASRLMWGEPTVMEGVRVTREDFERLNDWLARANVNFFVFPSSTLLYGLQNRVSPQPWLYFTPDHSFPISDMPKVDATIVASLKRNDVRAIVVERSSSQNEEYLRRMPALKGWLDSEYRKAVEFGLYEVWTLRSTRS